MSGSGTVPAVRERLVASAPAVSSEVRQGQLCRLLPACGIPWPLSRRGRVLMTRAYSPERRESNRVDRSVKGCRGAGDVVFEKISFRRLRYFESRHPNCSRTERFCAVLFPQAYQNGSGAGGVPAI